MRKHFGMKVLSHDENIGLVKITGQKVAVRF